MDGKENELKTFSEIVKAKCPIDPSRVASCCGNHDQQHRADVWKRHMFSDSVRENVTDDRNYSFVDGNFVFAFMSLANQNDRSHAVSGRICYLDDSKGNTRQWLENLVQESTGKTLILFMHFPFENKKCADKKKIEIDVYDWANLRWVKKTVNTAETAIPYAGIIDRGSTGETDFNNTGYGFYIPTLDGQDYSSLNECERIIDILKRHTGGKTIVFSGHTHTCFQCEDFEPCIGKGYPNINVAPITDTDIVTVHIPSLNNPRRLKNGSMGGGTDGWKTISESNPYRQPCQSWLVDVFDDRLVLKGYETNCCHDRKFGDILQQYTYVVDLEDFSSTDEGERS